MFPNCGWELSATPSMTSKSANSQLHFVKGKLGSETNNGKSEACTGQSAWNTSQFVNMSFGEFCNFTFSPIEKTKQCAFLGMNQDLVTLSANPLYNCMYLYVTNNVYSQCFNKFYLDCLIYGMIPYFTAKDVYLATNPTDILSGYKTNWSCNNGATVSEYCTLWHLNNTITQFWLDDPLTKAGHVSNIQFDNGKSQ